MSRWERIEHVRNVTHLEYKMTFTEEELTTLIRALEDHSIIFAWAAESETEHQDLQHYKDLQALKKRFERLLQKKQEYQRPDHKARLMHEAGEYSQ